MADATIGASVATIAPALTVIDGAITTTSLQVAQHFGKRHADVIRAIKNLLAEVPEQYQRIFALVDYTDEKGERRPSYRITRDGFTLLAMGFTGKEALQWKLAYIDAFNRMERELLSRTTRPVDPAIDYRRIDASQAQTLREAVAGVVSGGVHTFAETWGRLHRKFRVNSYHELPSDRFADALAYIRSLPGYRHRPTGDHDSATHGTSISLPQPDVIDMRALLLDGQADPQPLTAAQQAMVEHRAWVLAGEARELIQAHIERRIAFRIHQDRRSDDSIRTVVEGTTLGNAMTHHYSAQLRTMGSALQYWQFTAQQTIDRFKADMDRLSAAGAV